MKYIIRMDPVRPGDAPAMEQWLEDCAARGLSLVKLGSGFCLFKRGEEKKVRFRLAPSGIRTASCAASCMSRRGGSTRGAGTYSMCSARRTPRRRSPTPMGRAGPWP